jgi:superfamily II DNA or RNA helicase
VDKGIENNWEFHKIVTRLATKVLKGRTMILVERIPHGDYLANLISDALWVQGKDTLETRKYVLNQLKKAKEDVVAIATTGIFNTGINVLCHNLINTAGGKAEHQIIQRMGRGLRIADDKERLNYYDFYFKINDYLQEHSEKRIKILKKEGHEVILKNRIDF